MILYCAEIDEVIFLLSYGFDGEECACGFGTEKNRFPNYSVMQILESYHWEYVGFL